MKLVFFGAPGAGKGTIAKMINSEFGIVQISTGDLFRDNIKNKTPLGVEISGLLAKGELVPDSVTIELVKDRVQKDDCEKGYILDGFPRTLFQAREWEQIEPIDRAIYFEVEEELVKKRLIGRRMCKNCGNIYNVFFTPPMVDGKCDSCNSDLYTRDDDKEEAIVHRLEVYHAQTEPLLEYYKQLGKMYTVEAGKGAVYVTTKIKEEVLGK